MLCRPDFELTWIWPPRRGKEQANDPAGGGTYTWAGVFGTYFWVAPKNELIGVFMTQVSPPDFALLLGFKRLIYEAMTVTKK
jgi:CubicO group peptidase (beta-lactamase class C family)